MSDRAPKYIIAFRLILSLLALAAFVSLLSSLFVGWYWYQGCRQARVYNTLHQTHFTCGDFFWAGDQINTQTQTVHLQ